jgi:hypothetical protein
MKSIFKKAFGLALLSSAVVMTINAGPLESNGANFVPRAAGDYLFQEAGLRADDMHKHEKDEMYGSFSMNARYDQSFRGKRIAEGLLGADSAGVLNFQGSGITTRDNSNSIIADNFGLKVSSYDGKVTFDPRVQRFVADFNFHLGLDEWKKGLYVMVNAPLAWEKWEMRAKATDSAGNTNVSIAGDFSLAGLTDNLTSLSTALVGATNFGEKTEDLKWQKIQMDGKEANSSKFALADVDVQLGYNFIRKEDAHFGIFANVVAPTGNEQDNSEFFAPKVGHKNWLLGGGFNGFKRLSDKDDSQFCIRAGAKANYAFKNKEKRTFDFKDFGKMSRYLLLKKFATALTYDNALVMGPNVSTRDVDVKFDVMVDAFGQVEYRKDCYGFDLGYNFYYKAKEDISNASAASSTLYGVKGSNTVLATDLLNKSVADSSSDATIVKYATAYATGKNNFEKADNVNDNDKLDLVGNPSQYSHGVYGMAHYCWNENEWAPYIGLGAKGEFAGSNNANKKGVLNIWSVMAQGGLTF